MATIEKNKKAPLLQPDWTQMDGRSKPFFQESNNTHPNRYSVVVVSSYTTTGGSELQSRLSESIPSGVNHLLRYFDKVDQNSDTQSKAIIEDYYLPLRPGAKIKVLISLPEIEIEKLNDSVLVPLDLGNLQQIRLNTFDLRDEIALVNKMLTKYGEDINRFQGKVYGFDVAKQTSLLLNFVSSISELMSDNDLIFSSDKSDLIEISVTEDYDVVTVDIMQDSMSAKAPTRMLKGFGNFSSQDPVKDKRTIKLLQNLDNLNELQRQNKIISWTKFLETYIYNPPKIDFSKKRRNTEVIKQSAQKKIDKDNSTPVKDSSAVNFFKAEMWSPEQRKDFERHLDSVQDFVGDNVVGHLSQLSDVVNDTQLVYTQLLNKLGIADLVQSAMQCLNFPSLEFLDDAENFLNSADNILRQFQATISVPTMNFPDGYPITDFLADISIELAKSIVNAVVGALIDLVLELIKSLFDICSECAIEAQNSGAARFDKLNFGGMNWRSILDSGLVGDAFKSKVLDTTVGAIAKGTQEVVDIEGLSQEILVNALQDYDKLVDETAKKLQEASKNEITLEDAKAIVIEQNPFDGSVFKQASKELSNWLDASSNVLTPGELGNLLLGCETSTESKEVMENLLNPITFPALSAILDPIDIPMLWASLGKIVDRPAILEKVKEAAESVPQSLQCLCDEDDEALRKSLLSSKDPSLTPEELQSQIDKSKDRRSQRLNQLQSIANNPDFLKDIIPPLYCSIDKDGNLQQGLIPRTHPVLQQAVNESLDATFNSLNTTFNDDVNTYVSSLSIDGVEKRQVQRTKLAKIKTDDGVIEERIINPEFLRLVEEGRFSYGSLPAMSVVPGSRTIDSDKGEIDEGDEIYWSPFLDFLGFSGFNNRNAAGQWEEGQTRPTGEQEYEWELVNLDISGAGTKDFKISGGRTFSSDPKNTNSNDGVKDIEYTKKYGYSPIPIMVSERGKRVFAPGLKESFIRLCAGDDPYLKTISQQNKKNYDFNIPNNIAQNSGIDLSELQANFDKISGEILQIDSSQGNAQLDADSFAKMRNSIELVTDSNISFNYVVPYEESGQQITSSDSYSLKVQMNPSTAKPLEISKINAKTEINTKALTLIDGLEGPQYGTGFVQPQEGYFYNLLSNNLQVFDNSLNTVDFYSSLSNSKAYDGAFDDFLCTISDQISDSPYLSLEKMSTINLTPAKTFVSSSENGWVPQDCSPSLLDIDIIKKRIFEEYDFAQCFQEAFPDTNQFGGDERNVLQLSKRAGIILLTMRIYVLEFLLRSIFAFHYFGFKTERDIDDTMVEFLFDIFNRNLSSRSIGTNYRNKFVEETIKLYNRNVPNNQKAEGPDTNINFKIACKFLLKKQILSVSKRLSGLVEQKGDASLHTIFLEDWLPLVKVPTQDSESRFYEIGKDPNDPTGVLVSPTPKPLKSMIEQGEVFVLTEELIRSLTPGGALSKEAAERVSGNPGSQGMLYLKPIGSFFREYFAPNSDNREIPGLDLSSTRDRKELRDKINEIWPTRTTAAFKNLDINDGDLGVWKSREAALTGVEFPFANVVYSESLIKQAVKNAGSYIYDTGVSDAEKSLFTGENNEKGSIIDFITSAKNWTLPDSFNQQERGKPRGTGGSDFLIEGDFTNWWAMGVSDFFTEYITGHPDTGTKIPFASIRKIGPGSLLWARSVGAGVFRKLKKTHIDSIPRRTSSNPYTYRPYKNEAVAFLTDWHDFVLSPDQNDRVDLKVVGENSDWVRNVETAIKDVAVGNKAYISLLDLDIRMARNTLKWEREEYASMRDDLLIFESGATRDDPRYRTTWARADFLKSSFFDSTENGFNSGLLQSVIDKYDQVWIPAIENIIDLSQDAKKQREEMSKQISTLVAAARMPRNDLKKADKLYDITNGNFFQEFYIRVEDYEGGEQVQPPKDNLDYVQRDQWTKGVVDIEHWDNFFKDKFIGQNYPRTRKPTLFNEVTQEECGDALINDPTIRTVRREQTGDPQLDDFFKNIKFGMRISYLPPEQFTTSAASEFSKEEKSYIVSDTLGLKLSPIPVASVEIPINMSTKIKEVAPKTVTDPKNISETKSIDYFKWLFQAPMDIGAPRSNPRDILIRDIQKTKEYDFLFRYSFSLNRMLSLTNIYSSAYLGTLPNISTAFDPTKEELMYDFLYSLRAGDWRAADCFNSNLDISNALENGIPIPYAAITKLLVRTPLLIFKGFMEQSNLNIAIAKQIKQSIKAINQIIANAQRQANALQSAASQAGAQISALANTKFESTDCGFGISSPQALVNPPEAWFDPVDETFIPIPESWMLGLAMFPADIFFFFPLGPPITPNGLAYWALDDSRVNWLDQIPVEDYIEKMIRGNAQGNPPETPPPGECPIDVGLNPPGSGTNNGSNNG